MMRYAPTGRFGHQRLAVQVEDRDGVDLRLRVGLNSGQVITVSSVRVPWVTPPLVSRTGWHIGWNRSLRRVR